MEISSSKNIDWIASTLKNECRLLVSILRIHTTLLYEKVLSLHFNKRRASMALVYFKVCVYKSKESIEYGNFISSINPN